MAESESERRYSLNELRERFSREDIEIGCRRQLPVDIAIVHPNAAGLSREKRDPDLSKTYATLHFLDYDAVEMTTVEQDGSMDIEEVARMFGIDPDERVWEVSETV